MHVAVFCQYYHTPDCATSARPYSLVERLARDHEVTLITTRTWHRRRLTADFDWVPEGVRLHMLDVPYENAMSARERLGAYLKYAAKAVRRGLSISRPDVIYGSSTPLTAASAAATVARLRGVPWVFEVRDLWPDFPIQAGGLSNPLLQKLARAMEHHLYRDAAHVVTLSRDMEAHVRCCCPEAGPVTTVEYGTDRDLLAQAERIDLADLRCAYDFDGRSVVLYAGSFGRANGVPLMLEAARRLQDRQDVCFVFAGHGYHTASIKAAAQSLPNVRLLPAQPHLRALALFRLADLALVPFADLPVLSANSPAKLYDSLAAGTPVVVTNPGWTKTLVEKYGCGWYAPAAQPAALAERIACVLDRPEEREAAGARGAHLAQRHFDRAVHMETLHAIVESVGPARRAFPVPTLNGNGHAHPATLPLQEKPA